MSFLSTDENDDSSSSSSGEDNQKILGVSDVLGNTGEMETTPRKYVFDVTSAGQRNYVLDVTSTGQPSSPWTCNLSESRDRFHVECKLHFPRVQPMLRKMH